ncbi:MAG TPA: response regulator, partial [Acetobacteraceae bacterium]|nr:response regulator [Acetobacteraceae bacterium]
SRIADTRLPQDAAQVFPATHNLSEGDGPWPFAEAARTDRAVLVSGLPDRIGAFPAPLWPDLVHTAVVLPLPAPGQAAATGFLVVGVSPRRVLDADYRSFLDLAAEHIGSAIAEARVFEEERRRAEALAELDRAKTAFFSNVSHEFRTPLTLMLGPLEELLAKAEPELPNGGRELAGVAHRNGLRLLRLVNTLLDFSRIEAGRAEAAYEPTDLALLTAELASSFRSACERAGLRLEVECPSLRQPVYVDRDMWEKIVLNLLSNAFKFTLEGEIRVSLTDRSESAELLVADTGVGIDRAELPRLFERFHRIEGQRSRSHEGSGIGLALVQELVRLHGGRISVDSQLGRGTALAVTLPLGTAHLPPDRIGAPRALSSPNRASAFVEEALRWLPDGDPEGEAVAGQGEPVAEPAGSSPAAHLLVADDNSDMRDYLVRLLSRQGWDVKAVADGIGALAAARRRRPDLVLADIMMPGLDGLGLTEAMRREPDLASVPIVLLSARAGEAAQLEGLASGADDYLVKPFAARELLARVHTHLALSRLRAEAAERVRLSEARLQAAVDLVGLCPYSWDPATGALDWGDRLRAIWGLPPGAYVDETVFLSGIHPDDRARVEAAIERCRDPASGGIYAIQYRVVGIGDGIERWVSTYGQTMFRDGTPVGFVGAAVDITERKRAEDRLRASEERFRRFAEHLASVLWIVDVEAMRVEYVNPAFERVWGLSRADVADRSPEVWLGAVHPEDRERAAELVGRAKEGEGTTVEYRIIRPDGAMRWVRDTSFPIRDRGGRVLRVGGIAQDLTRHDGRLVYVVDGDQASRRELDALLQAAGYEVKPFATTQAFIEMASVLVPGCVVLDARISARSGPAVPRELQARRIGLPVIVIGADGDVAGAVQALKAGASDWLEASTDPQALHAAVASALATIQEGEERDRHAALARARIASMSSREREVLTGMMVGETNKSIARRLGISPRTVEIHRAHVMERLGARTLSEAVLLASAAGLSAERT